MGEGRKTADRVSAHLPVPRGEEIVNAGHYTCVFQERRFQEQVWLTVIVWLGLAWF